MRLAERADADFAHLIARLLVFATWRLALLDRLAGVAPTRCWRRSAPRASRSSTYHREYAAGWVVRLGDGTEVSHRRMQDAMDAVWPLIGELFRPYEVERRLGVDPSALRPEFDAVLAQVLAAATLRSPAAAEPAARTPAAGDAGGRGREGVHTAALTGSSPRCRASPGRCREASGDHRPAGAPRWPPRSPIPSCPW